MQEKASGQPLSRAKVWIACAQVGRGRLTHDSPDSPHFGHSIALDWAAGLAYCRCAVRLQIYLPFRKAFAHAGASSARSR